MYFPALDYLPENLSDKPFEVIGIELKGWSDCGFSFEFVGEHRGYQLEQAAA